MPRIVIESKPVASSFNLKEHLYLVYQDGKGNELVIRGGPQCDLSPSCNDYGRIIIENGINLELSSDKRIDTIAGTMDTPYDRHQREVNLGGRKAEDIWNIMTQHAQNIANANFPYDIFSNPMQNSNSVIASVLNAAGIRLADNLPRGMEFSDFPGASNLLNFNTVLIGTDRADKFGSGPGNDRFTGQSGLDSYVFSGNFGRDTVIDSDNDGIIMVNGVALQGTAKLAEGTSDTYVLNTGKESFALTKSGNDLRIAPMADFTASKTSPAKSISIKDYFKDNSDGALGRFGITLSTNNDGYTTGNTNISGEDPMDYTNPNRIHQITLSNGNVVNFARSESDEHMYLQMGGKKIRVSDKPAGPDYGSVVVHDIGDGRLVTLWHVENQMSEVEIYIQVFDYSGQKIGKNIIVNTPHTASYNWASKITNDGNKGFYVQWFDNINYQQTHQFSVLGRHFAYGGQLEGMGANIIEDGGNYVHSGQSGDIIISSGSVSLNGNAGKIVAVPKGQSVINVSGFSSGSILDFSMYKVSNIADVSITQRTSPSRRRLSEGDAQVDTVIDLGENQTIILENTLMANLTDDNFLFAQQLAPESLCEEGIKINATAGEEVSFNAGLCVDAKGNTLQWHLGDGSENYTSAFSIDPETGVATSIAPQAHAQLSEIAVANASSGFVQVPLTVRGIEAASTFSPAFNPALTAQPSQDPTLPGAGQQQDNTGLIAGATAGGVALFILGATALYRFLTRTTQPETRLATAANDNRAAVIRLGADFEAQRKTAHQRS